MDQRQILSRMIGQWSGECRTWFKPGELADESALTGEISQVLSDQFLAFSYSGMMMGNARSGREWLAYNETMGEFQCSWIDTFHTAGGIIFSVGKPMQQGFFVTGSYSAGPDQPVWHWRTEYQMPDANSLKITAWNITPAGEEYKALETVLSRVK